MGIKEFIKEKVDNFKENQKTNKEFERKLELAKRKAKLESAPKVAQIKQREELFRIRAIERAKTKREVAKIHSGKKPGSGLIDAIDGNPFGGGGEHEKKEGSSQSKFGDLMDSIVGFGGNPVKKDSEAIPLKRVRRVRQKMPWEF